MLQVLNHLYEPPLRTNKYAFVNFSYHTALAKYPLGIYNCCLPFLVH